MMTAILIVSVAASLAVAWWVSRLWTQWEADYRKDNKGPPPGGDTIGYLVVIAAFIGTTIVVSNILVRMG